MKIGLLGTGNMGRILARKLPAAGHEVKVANSRGPDSISGDVLEKGARATTVEDALANVDVVILAMPSTGFEKIRPLIAALPDDTVLIETSNYLPQRDGHNPALEAGQVESEWVQEFFGRPVTKAWNSIGSDSFERKGQPRGTPGRIALPVAADRARDRDIAISLVEDTGFDGYDAGVIADSWRQQPAAPVYCTDLTREEMGRALALAEKDRLPIRRSLAFDVIMERIGTGNMPDADFLVRVGRTLYM
ncbi:MAG: NAD(P)-binding domain-containing protein [Stagnimonas sp.]|nr:NAD(P)-binding domain-containing protein [Stagnimonas sp.]